MDRPWQAECTPTLDEIHALVEGRFPELAPARVVPLAEGWDNAAYVVNDEWVFRFPRREIASELLVTESRVLPAIAGRLPLAVPVPELIGAPADGFPWPFTGYRMLPGRTACRAGLTVDQRDAAAVPLARFVAALHAIPAAEARALGAGPDTLGRLDVARRAERARQRLVQAIEAAVLDAGGASAIEAIVDDAPRAWTPAASCLCHGDLYFRHLLVDDGALCGVIDWGDVHAGDPAVDLAVAWSFLAPAGRDVFRREYECLRGPVDDDAWRVARFSAIFTIVVLLLYAHDTGDDDLMAGSRRALDGIILPT